MKPRLPRHQPRQKPRLNPACNKETTPTTPTRARTRVIKRHTPYWNAHASRAYVCLPWLPWFKWFQRVTEFLPWFMAWFFNPWRGFEVGHG